MAASTSRAAYLDSDACSKWRRHDEFVSIARATERIPFYAETLKLNRRYQSQQALDWVQFFGGHCDFACDFGDWIIAAVIHLTPPPYLGQEARPEDPQMARQKRDRLNASQVKADW